MKSTYGMKIAPQWLVFVPASMAAAIVWDQQKMLKSVVSLKVNGTSYIDFFQRSRLPDPMLVLKETSKRKLEEVENVFRPKQRKLKAASLSLNDGGKASLIEWDFFTPVFYQRKGQFMWPQVCELRVSWKNMFPNTKISVECWLPSMGSSTNCVKKKKFSVRKGFHASFSRWSNADRSMARYCSPCRGSLPSALIAPAEVSSTSAESRIGILRMIRNFLSNVPTTEGSRMTFAKTPTS